MVFIKWDTECYCVLLVGFMFAAFQPILLVDSKVIVTTTPLPTTIKSDSNSSTVKPTLMKNESEVLESNASIPLTNLEVKSVIEVEGNSTKTSNSTLSNYIAQYTPLVFDSPEDIKTQQEWGGNCTLKHWDQCKVLVKWFGKYEDPKDGEIKEYLIDCKEEPVVCLKNSWTVTRCNLLCMSRCNREIQFKYEKYVASEGECQAHAHG